MRKYRTPAGPSLKNPEISQGVGSAGGTRIVLSIACPSQNRNRSHCLKRQPLYDDSYFLTDQLRMLFCK